MRQRGKERSSPALFSLLFSKSYQCLPLAKPTRTWETAFRGPLIPLPSLSSPATMSAEKGRGRDGLWANRPGSSKKLLIGYILLLPPTDLDLTGSVWKKCFYPKPTRKWVVSWRVGVELEPASLTSFLDLQVLSRF